jgi:OOP family OmpA-OmpF porin
LEASFSLLDEIAGVIKNAPHIKKVAIEGHASAEGNKAVNLKLSDDRAKSVMKYLVDKGIEKERLTAKGYGSTKPIAENDSEEGREKNRRVEFNIVEQDVTQKKVEIDATTGKEKVVEEKKSLETKEIAKTPEELAADKKAAEKKEAADKAAEKKAAQAKPKPLKEAAPKPDTSKAAAAPAAPKAPAAPAAPAK